MQINAILNAAGALNKGCDRATERKVRQRAPAGGLLFSSNMIREYAQMNVEGNAVFSQKNVLLSFLVIVLVTGSVYSMSLLNGFILDDESIIVSNPTTHSLNYLSNVLFSPDVVKPYYRPLNRASYLVDYQLFGLNPVWFHAVNIFIHMMSAVLLYLVACRLLADRGAALIVALLFAVHPANSEAVNFISARNTLLALFFCLASLLVFMKAQEKGVRWPFLSALLFFCGLLSKETAFMLIAVITLYALSPSPGSAGKMLRDKLFSLSPYLLALVVYFAMRSYSLQGGVGAAVPVDGLLSRLAMNYHIIPQYVRLLLFPDDLTVFHTVPVGNLLSPPWFLPVWAALIVAAWLILRWRNKAAMFGLVWCALNYLPISNIVPIPSDPITERFLYMPAVGFFIILGTLVTQLNLNARTKHAVTVAVAVVVALLALVTFQRNREWKDDYSLFLSGERNNPASAEAHYNLGTALLQDRGDIEAARLEWETALSIDPGNSDALIQMGTYTAVKGDLEKAEQFYNTALLAPPGKTDPDKTMAHFNLGKIYEKQQKLAEALKHYELFLKFVTLHYVEYKPFAEQRVAYLRTIISSSSH
jgi:protein O-mannosyl-transferase